MNAVLQVEGLTGGYGKLAVFRDVSLHVNAQETLGILGPNGAGKTTMLTTISGYLPHHAGRVVLEGSDISRARTNVRVRRGIGHVPEGRHIFGTLTVADNLALTRAATGGTETHASYATRLEEVFDLFPRLKERRDQLAGTLSGGEQQMLAIARALLLKPKLLLLDEPTQGLAPVIVQELERVLAKLKSRFAIILVEQNRTFLERLCDRTLTMRGGRCYASDSHAEPSHA